MTPGGRASRRARCLPPPAVMRLRLALLASAFLTAPAGAQIVVDSAADAADGADGVCTLREAITAAATDTASGSAAGECPAGDGEDAIEIAVAGTITLTANLPYSTESVSITGPTGLAEGVTIDGAEAYRAFGFSTAGQSFALRGVTVRDARAFSGAAASVFDASTLVIEDATFVGNVSSGGGAIVSDGPSTLVLERVTVTDNEATGPGGGGGLSSFGTTTIRNSTFSGNRATHENGGGAGLRHLSNSVPASLVLFQTTISGNTANDGGGGVWILGSAAEATITACTIVGNRGSDDGAGALGGGLAVTQTASESTTVQSTVVAGNTSGQLSGPDDVSAPALTSLGGNLVGVEASAFPAGSPNATGDLVGTASAPLDPMLAELADAGGATAVHLPVSGSPVLDAGVCSGAEADQRGGGNAREIDEPGVADANGDACDVGAVEGTVSTTAAEPGAAAWARLDAPYPSPTRDRATVAFSLARPAVVSLTVVDLLGRRVAVLAEGHRAAGPHAATLGTRGLAPGVYLVRLVAGGERWVRRVVVAG